MASTSKLSFEIKDTNHKTISNFRHTTFTTDGMDFVKFRVLTRQRKEKIDSPVS